MEAQVSKGLTNPLTVTPAGPDHPSAFSSSDSQSWNAWVATVPTLSTIDAPGRGRREEFAADVRHHAERNGEDDVVEVLARLQGAPADVTARRPERLEVDPVERFGGPQLRRRSAPRASTGDPSPGPGGRRPRRPSATSAWMPRSMAAIDRPSSDSRSASTRWKNQNSTPRPRRTS